MANVDVDDIIHQYGSVVEIIGSETQQLHIRPDGLLVSCVFV